MLLWVCWIARNFLFMNHRVSCLYAFPTKVTIVPSILSWLLWGPFQDPFQTCVPWMMLLKCNIVTSTANLHLRKEPFSKYHSSLSDNDIYVQNCKCYRRKKPAYLAAIFTKNVSLFIINQKRLRCSIYPAQKILLKIQKLKKPLMNPWKSQFQTIFTKLASVWSVWSQMLPESLSTARWMIQGQKFTVRISPKGGEAHKLSMKLQTQAAKPENKTSKWSQPCINKLSFYT